MEIYDNGNVRRQDRLLDEDKALGLLSTGEYGILSMWIGNEGYGIPLNYVWDQKNLIYLHELVPGRIGAGDLQAAVKDRSWIALEKIIECLFV